MGSSYAGSRSSTHIFEDNTIITHDRGAADPFIDILYTASGPKPNEKRKLCNADKRKSHASRLSLLQATLCDTLRLVHLGGVTGGLEGVAGGGQGLQVSAVLFLGLERC